MSMPTSSLYGRRTSIARLTSACRQMHAQQPVWVLIEGPAGIGKTSLVKFVRNALQFAPTQFGAGKFEQFHRQTPYGALIIALRRLLQAVMALPQPERLTWRHVLHQASAGKLAPLADVLPELPSLMGALPQPSPLPPKETQERLEAAFVSFVGCFARSDHPLMLFLDDLQWADIATLRLLRRFGSGNRLGNLILLGTFRDNEVSALHPLTQLLDSLEKQSTTISRIRLGPLSAVDIGEWLTSAFHLTPPATAALATWLLQQSEGNPLFVGQLIGSLREHQVLYQDAADETWQWDAAKLSQLHLAGNVAGFMEARLRELPPVEQNLLSCAASLGNEFRVNELASILAMPHERVTELLARTEEARLTKHIHEGNWQFSHDRIQQAAYRLLPEAERKQQHLHIGLLLLASTAPDKLDAACFDLAAQFNHAPELLSPDERLAVADLNLRAGRRAKAAAAFEAALVYFRSGHSLLPDSAWEDHYPLMFELVKESAECAYATGELAIADQLFKEALRHARNRLDRARIYGIMIMFALNAGRAQDAWQLGGICLAEFGIALGGDNDALGLAIEQEEPLLRRRLTAEDPQRLIAEQTRCTEEQEAVADLLLRLYVAGYQTGKNPYAYITLRMLEYGLDTRHKAALAFGMMSFAVILGARHGAYQEAEGYAHTALQLAQQLNDPQLRSRIDYIYGSMVAHWTQPVKVGMQALERCYEQALVGADKVYIGLALSFQFRARIMTGEAVPSLLEAWEQSAPVIHQIQSVPITAVYTLNRQWLLAWQEKTASPTCLDSENFSSSAFEQQLQALPAKSPYHWFGLLQAILAYVHDEPALAQRWIAHADDHLDAVAGQLAVPEHHFWRGLILHAAGDRTALAGALQMMDRWQADSADNFGHRANLLRAELLRAEGRTDAALAAYHAAIAQSRTHQHVLLLALSLERLADYFTALELPHQAQAYLQEAYVSYQTWGALSKLRQLRARYPRQALATGITAPIAFNPEPQQILAALGDIHLDRMLRQLLPALMDTVGASRVAACILRDDELMLEGHCAQEPNDDHPLPLAIRHAPDYPGALIADSCAARQSIMLVCPARHPQYGAHECWHMHQAASVLCLPILRNDRLLGVLYMEHPAETGFTGVLSWLEAILPQVGAALENALLYADLEQQIAERTRAEKIAREGERRWRAFLDHAHMAVVTLDLSGTIEYVNPYLCTLMGYSSDDLVGKDWVRALLPAYHHHKPLHATLAAQLRTHGHHNDFVKVRTCDGEERPFAWSSSLLRDADGRPVGSISIGSDMTDQRNAENALRRLNEELEQRVLQRTSDLAAANQELDSFAYSVSHDLRAPLRSIDGFSQALAEDYGDVFEEQAKDYLRRVRNAARRMGGMIDAMLHMSRQTRGALVIEEVDLSAMAADVIAELRQRTPQRSVNVTIAPGLVARADSRLMRVVLDNLLGNAWKYTGKMQHAEIDFNACQENGEIVYRVSDNGPGFDMTHADKLFDAFQRLHANDIEGHGIGLTTAKRIIHRHGGKIWAEASPGAGAVFFFMLKVSSLA